MLLLERKRYAVTLLEQMLGWWNAADMDRKHGRRRHGGPTLSPEERKLINEANQLDDAVYTAAETMLKLDLIVFASPHSPEGHTADNPLTCANPKRKFPKK